ncbi:hypothetical protein MMC34_001247 [Xylographa carneopallida]|nr:hypothetical protein [Xylographa carneopallida]
MPKGSKTAIPKSHRTDPYPTGTTNMSSHANPSHPHGGMAAIGNERLSTAWSHDDDELLMRSRAQNMNWAPIAATHFPSKTPNACRKRHERLMEKKNAENWDGVKLEELARAYVDSREMMWKILADKVGEKWQHVETKCMEKGLKTLQSAARPRRAKASTSPTSPLPSEHSHSYDPDFDDSGLGPDAPPSHSSPHSTLNLDPPRHQRQPSHRTNPSLQSTPGASHASLQLSGYGDPVTTTVNYPSNYLPTLQHPGLHHGQQVQQQAASRLPSFSTGFGAQLFQGSGAPISASY